MPQHPLSWKTKLNNDFSDSSNSCFKMSFCQCISIILSRTQLTNQPIKQAPLTLNNRGEMYEANVFVLICTRTKSFASCDAACFLSKWKHLADDDCPSRRGQNQWYKSRSPRMWNHICLRGTRWSPGIADMVCCIRCHLCSLYSL